MTLIQQADRPLAGWWCIALRPLWLRHKRMVGKFLRIGIGLWMVVVTVPDLWRFRFRLRVGLRTIWVKEMLSWWP